ncbi:MAG: tetratricopeptide repeat protein [Wenzhouxiangella sp.]|jgi:TolB-like protein/Flp pilus assembly protein TadD|nr:tetratricopeptide repeat protein [Wenzhouxiangella sp.]
MTEISRGLNYALRELKRRHVFRVMGGYIVSFWVVLQVGDVILGPLGAPDWVMLVLISIGIVGAPVVFALSWFYDLTTEGVRRTDRAEEYAVPADPVQILGGRWVDYVIIAALVLILAFVLLQRDASRPSVGSSIAVLPFSDLSADQSNQYFADGIAEAIMDRLAQVAGIQLSARTSSFALRDAGLDARETAQRLGVESLLEGSVRRSGSRLRISTRLIDGNTGTQVWSETFDGALTDVFELQDQISRAIAGVMEVQLNLPVIKDIATGNPLAYDQYLRGRDLLRQAPSRSNLDQAVSFFVEALEVDPDFALAAAGLCRVRWEQYELLRDPQLAEIALDQCEDTERRFPNLAETQVAIGSLLLGTGRLGQAEQAFRNALRREANNAEALAGLGLALLRGDDLDGAEQQTRRAIEMDPAYWLYHSQLATILYFDGRLDAAFGAVQQAIRLSPNNPEPLNLLGAIYFAQGQFLKAGDAFERSIQQEPNAVAYSNAGTNYFFAQELTRAEAMFQRAVELAPDDPRLAGFLAWSIRAQPSREADAAPHHWAVIRNATERLAINAQDQEARSAMALHLAALDQDVAAQAALDGLGTYSELGENALLTTGFAHYLLGQNSLAIQAFDLAIGKGLPFYLIEADPRLKAAWNDVDFAALAARHQDVNPINQGESS